MNPQQAIRQRERQPKVAALVDSSPDGITTNAVAEALGISRSAAYNDLRMLGWACKAVFLRPAGVWCSKSCAIKLAERLDRDAMARCERERRATKEARERLNGQAGETARKCKTTGPASVWELAGGKP